MYKIIFYKDRKGYNEVEEYIKELASKRKEDKNSRIKLTKITNYMDLLAKNGLNLGEPYIKHLENNIWELRALRDRILFAYIENNKFIILSKFMKTTQKTPKKEIKRAINLFRDYKRGRKE